MPVENLLMESIYPSPSVSAMPVIGDGQEVGVAVGLGVRVGVRVGMGVLVGVGEGPKVGVNVGSGGLITAFGAAAASTIPLPQVEVLQLLPAGNARAVLWRI